MDNRYEPEINSQFFNENNNNRETSWGPPPLRRNSRTRSPPRRQTTTDEDITTLFDFMSEYNENIRNYQANIRQYQETSHLFLNIVNSLAVRDRNARNRAAQQQSARPTPRYYATGANPYRFTNWNSIYTNLVNDTLLRHINNVLPSLNEDVVVRPTPEQFNNATRIFQYADGENDIATHCPITLEEFREDDMVCQIRHCGHCFKEDAIRNWFRQKVRCPVCRYDIRDYVDPEAVAEESSNDEDPPPSPVDVSSNEIPPPPTEEPPRRVSQIDHLVRNLSNGLSNILQNYLDEGSNSNNNDVLTFEFPIVFYNDMSGNGLRFQNPR